MLRAAVVLARSAAAATARRRTSRRIARGHDSSVMRRYNAYSANQVMTTTAATSMISKNSTTPGSLAAGRPRLSVAVGE